MVRETPPSAGSLDQVWLADACLGRGLPVAAEKHLALAGRNYHDDAIAEGHLREAQALAPDHVAVLIGLYRFYFYKGRLREALEVAEQCLEKAARDNGLSGNWREVRPHEADFSNYAAVLPRFFLFTLKGYGYLQMRLGKLEQGREALDKLLELDPGDKLGGTVLIKVLERIGQDDED